MIRTHSCFSFSLSDCSLTVDQIYHFISFVDSNMASIHKSIECTPETKLDVQLDATPFPTPYGLGVTTTERITVNTQMTSTVDAHASAFTTQTTSIDFKTPTISFNSSNHGLEAGLRKNFDNDFSIGGSGYVQKSSYSSSPQYGFGLDFIKRF